MPQKKYIVRLTDEEREICRKTVRKLKASSEKVRRAQILLKADADGPGWKDQQIADALSCRTKTVENVRQRCVQEGFERALERKLICALEELQGTPRPRLPQDLNELFQEAVDPLPAAPPASTAARHRPTSTSSARRPARVTFDDVRQAVQNRQGWNEDCDADGRERWYGPCPIQHAPGCRASAGAEHLGDKQEVLMACNACNPHNPGHLGLVLFLKHLDALECRRSTRTRP